MAEDDERRGGRDDYGMGRLLALSDGVFAIAMTILVLVIPIPDLGHPDDRHLLAAVGQLAPAVLSFALSFVLVGFYWISHRRLLRNVARSSGPVTGLNLVLLLMVCLVPLSSAFLNRYGYLATAVVIYAINLAVLGLLMLLLQVATWRGDLVRPRPSARDHRIALFAGVLGIGVFVASVPLALYDPSAGEYFWLVLLPVATVSRWLRGRKDEDEG